MSQEIFELLRADSVIYANRTLAASIGLNEAVIFSALLGKEYYYKSVDKLDEEDMFYSTAADLEASMTLTQRQQERAIRHLEELGLIETNITRRLRLHRIANTLVTMYNAGVELFRKKKEDLFSSQNGNNIKIDKPCFYTSREFKGFNDDAIKVKNGRAVGVLMTGMDIYMVYNTENYDMKWASKSELDMKAEISGYLSVKWGVRHKINGFVFGNSMGMMVSETKETRKSKNGFFFVDTIFRKFIYLTNDRYRETLLKILCDSAMRNELDEILRDGLNPANKSNLIENDAIDKNGNPILFAYLPDMPRLKRFRSALELHKKSGTVICFDFQEETLAKYCGELVDFETIDFEILKKNFQFKTGQ